MTVPLPLVIATLTQSDFFSLLLASAMSCDSASIQSVEELPGHPIVCRRSDMKYARNWISSREMTGASKTGSAVDVFETTAALVRVFLVFATGAAAVFAASFDDAFATFLSGVFTALAVRVLVLADADLLVVFAGILRIFESESAICKINLQKNKAWVRFSS